MAEPKYNLTNAIAVPSGGEKPTEYYRSFRMPLQVINPAHLSWPDEHLCSSTAYSQVTSFGEPSDTLTPSLCPT